MEKKIKIPETLDEAIEILKEYLIGPMDEIKEMTENSFIANVNHILGTYLRNEWYLWWYKDHTNKWPKEQPKLNKYFESIGITHADDMSSIILTCFYRNLHSKEYNITEQVKKYQKHWKQYGYSDGIPKH